MKSIIFLIALLSVSVGVKSQTTDKKSNHYWTLQAGLGISFLNISSPGGSDVLQSEVDATGIGFNYHYKLTPNVRASIGSLVSIRTVKTSGLWDSDYSTMLEYGPTYSAYLSFPLLLEMDKDLNIGKLGISAGPKLDLNFNTISHSKSHLSGDPTSGPNQLFLDLKAYQMFNVGYIVGTYWRNKKDHQLGFRYHADISRYRVRQNEMHFQVLELYFQARL